MPWGGGGGGGGGGGVTTVCHAWLLCMLGELNHMGADCCKSRVCPHLQLGRQMAEFPIDPMMSKMIMASAK